MWNMMNDGAMHWDMGLIGILVVVVLVLGAVALARYIFTRQTSAGQAGMAIDDRSRRIK